jgi:hypothetical protein
MLRSGDRGSAAGLCGSWSAPAPDAVNSRTTWLSTVNEDCSPHVTAVGALWLDGTFWFQTGARTRKDAMSHAMPRHCLLQTEGGVWRDGAWRSLGVLGDEPLGDLGFVAAGQYARAIGGAQRGQRRLGPAVTVEDDGP